MGKKRDLAPNSSSSASTKAASSVIEKKSVSSGSYQRTYRKYLESLSAKIDPEKLGASLEITILVLIYLLAFLTRLFSVLRYESVIHEFDPYFNFRSTKFLVNEGFYNFLNWFDQFAWYPLGRIIGGTIYPGLMMSAAAVYWLLHSLHVTIDIRNVCVLLAPFFASNTAVVGYFFAKQLGGSSAGLFAAAFLAIVPGYISRSVAGSYDNEGIAIFALLLTYTLWLVAVKSGSLFHAALCALAYFYMVSAWGGYVFIINLIPLHVFVLLVIGRYSDRLYVAYSTFYVLGTLLSMQITFVGFQPVQSSEHLAALAVFGLLQLSFGYHLLRSLLTTRTISTRTTTTTGGGSNAESSAVVVAASEELFHVAVRWLLTVFLTIGGLFLGIGILTGYISPFTGRFYSLLDPTYAKAHIPIIASVSEHQPTAWSSFFFDLHILVFLFPVGLYYCFRRMTDLSVFAILYGITSIYFAGVMVRLMLVLAPIACILSALGLSATLKTYTRMLHPSTPSSSSSSSSSETTDLMGNLFSGKPSDETSSSSATTTGAATGGGSGGGGGAVVSKEVVATVVTTLVTVLLVLYVLHCRWVTSEAYSSPSIVLAVRAHDGSRIIFDDFREAYSWLRHNTAEDAKVMSWWDYGYQLSAMANRTVLVDNNTWNNTHISQVGKAMASSEDKAIEIMRRMNVNYVLVVFGGLAGYSSDDINKFLWMVRIGGSTDPNIRESDYYTRSGEFRVDASGSPVLLNCMMYKCCYYRFGEMYTEQGRPTGWDRVRGVEIGRKDFELDYLEEAFTSQHWIVRIYKVKEEANRA